MDTKRLDLRNYGKGFQHDGDFIWASDKMRWLKEVINQAANSNVDILIQGETGVGKEVVARLIYRNSPRKTKPFIKVHCAALPEELLEIEMFGYEKGAFTGAYRNKRGKFELADRGTIFLDEISEMPLPLQAKLLQVLRDRTFSRLGSKREIGVDVRILAATNKNMGEAVKNGSFREDLYYRLNVINITIPPLRERKEEIPVFVEHFLNKFRKKYHVQVDSISDPMMRALLDQRWLGNIRELETVIRRIILLRDEKQPPSS